MPHELIANPGCGAESHAVTALALSSDGTHVAAVATGLGTFFDAATAARVGTWEEPSTFEHIAFRDDGALLVVSRGIASVGLDGARVVVSDKVFKEPPYDAMICDGFLVGLHRWETSGGGWRSSAIGVSLADGSKTWEVHTELCALVLHGGLLLAARGHELVRIDPETGDLAELASLPEPVGAAWSDGASLYLAEREGFTLHRIDPTGSVAASASMADPIPFEDKPAPAIVQMARLGDALVVRTRNFTPANLGPVPWMSEDALELLDADSLEPLETTLTLDDEPEAMLSVANDLWVGTGRGLHRFTR